MPNIKIPILKQFKVSVPINKVEKAIVKSTYSVMDWMNWLKNSGKTIVKKASSSMESLKARVNNIFKRFLLIESKSASKQFTMVHAIDGVDGYDPESFLKAVRHVITTFVTENRQAKVKLVMEKVSLAGDPEGGVGSTTQKDAAFHSNTRRY